MFKVACLLHVKFPNILFLIIFLVRVLVVQNVIRHLTQLSVSTVRPKTIV